MTTRLARAAAHVAAAEMPDGFYAYYADETSSWYMMPAKELAELCDYLDHDDPAIAGDAYSHWCAGQTDVEEMPAWWHPDPAERAGCAECDQETSPLYWSCCGDPVGGASGSGCGHDAGGCVYGSVPVCGPCGAANGWQSS